VRLAQASRPTSPNAPTFISDWVNWGAGTRGSQSLLLAAKARALLKDRVHVSCPDIRQVAPAALRHRILTNFRADAERIDSDRIIAELLDTIEEPSSGLG
jgi:MoxR-like ATPase